DHNSATFAVALNTSVREVKRLILQRHWPSSPNLIPATQVDRIRLFAAGKELGGKGTDDVKSLKDANILLSKNGPTPVHVMAVQKDITAEKSATTTENSSNSLKVLLYASLMSPARKCWDGFVGPGLNCRNVGKHMSCGPCSLPRCTTANLRLLRPAKGLHCLGIPQDSEFCEQVVL
ncbi:Tiparp, partial [Symbiodinium necroappetens]